MSAKLSQQRLNTDHVTLDFAVIYAPSLCLFFRQMTSNQMQGHFWHQFLAQLFMLFHMVTIIFFSMAAPKTATLQKVLFLICKKYN